MKRRRKALDDIKTICSMLPNNNEPCSQAESVNRYKLRAVLKGHRITKSVVGGVVKVPAPSDGFVVDMPDEDVFIGASDAIRILGGLCVDRCDDCGYDYVKENTK